MRFYMLENRLLLTDAIVRAENDQAARKEVDMWFGGDQPSWLQEEHTFVRGISPDVGFPGMILIGDAMDQSDW